MTTNSNTGTQQIGEAEIDALFARTLEGEIEDDGRWEAIHKLRRVGGRRIFEIAMKWCNSVDDRKRISGVDILAQIGKTSEHRETEFSNESYPVIESLLRSDPPNELKDSAIMALHYLENPAAIPLICSFRNDPDENIRFAVACALGYTFANDALAIETLLGLTRDADEEVRDWATFSLGVQGDADSPTIREALFERLSDSYLDAREEAIAGLAKRKDLRVLPILTQLFQAGEISYCTEEAARSLLDADTTDNEWGAEEYLAALQSRYGVHSN